MDRTKWDAMVGEGKGSVIDDLEWRLFEARRLRTSCLRHRTDEGLQDPEVADMAARQIVQYRVALAALYVWVTVD